MNRRRFVRNIASAIVGVVASVYAPGVVKWGAASTKVALVEFARAFGDITSRGKQPHWPAKRADVSADGGFIVPEGYVALVRNSVTKRGYLTLSQEQYDDIVLPRRNLTEEVIELS